MSYVDESNKRIILIVPDNTDIHVYTELKEIISSLNPFCTERRMEWIFGKHGKL